eukprot:8588189-Lingulodinium_polyedra.AAC.1
MSDARKRSRTPSAAALAREVGKQLKAQACDAKAPAGLPQGEETRCSAEPLAALLAHAAKHVGQRNHA